MPWNRRWGINPEPCRGRDRRSPLRRITPLASALVSAATLGAIAPLALAQDSAFEQRPEPLRDFRSPDANPRSVDGSPDGVSPMRLIQNIMLQPGQSSTEFRDQQDSRLDDAAEAFRRQQQQQLQTPATRRPSEGAIAAPNP
jgi:hypothetical protein